MRLSCELTSTPPCENLLGQLEFNPSLLCPGALVPSVAPWPLANLEVHEGGMPSADFSLNNLHPSPEVGVGWHRALG